MKTMALQRAMKIVFGDDRPHIKVHLHLYIFPSAKSSEEGSRRQIKCFVLKQRSDFADQVANHGRISVVFCVLLTAAH